ncbi:hypothetical protein RFI_32442 [Reticulomyxa filosa]|uniref:Uncharacterized protein n=1 Tax=Reticulomyxa filosa TaxID=46433 RepID=X6LSS7_RETFI|nr:hypothetical protein RFI_32442 [Reticulomyxa filosa]|eukprot:ETO04953.1 hypothetical protein RFI_32442 [Reticulomyxa filosa]
MKSKYTVFGLIKKHVSHFPEKVVALFEKLKIGFLQFARELNSESKVQLITQLLDWTRDDPKSNEKIASLLNKYIAQRLIENTTNTKDADLLFKVMQIMPFLSDNNMYKLSNNTILANDIRFLPFFIRFIKVYFLFYFIFFYQNIFFFLDISVSNLSKRGMNIGKPYS